MFRACCSSSGGSTVYKQQSQQLVQSCVMSTDCCLYTVDTPDNEQQACSKHVEAYYWNKLKENIASCWFILYGYITTRGQKSLKFPAYSLEILMKRQTEGTRMSKDQYEERISQVLIVQLSIWIFCNLVFNNLYNGKDIH